jgi:hypothetical protein
VFINTSTGEINLANSTPGSHTIRYSVALNSTTCIAAGFTDFPIVINPVVNPTFSFGTTLSICSGGIVPALPTSSSNSITGTWSPAIVDNANNGTYTFTPDAGQCANTTTFTVTITPQTTPTFAFGTSLTACQGDVSIQVLLPTLSNNSISGTWNPSTIDYSILGQTIYTFTPDAGQCANANTFTVTITPQTTPMWDESWRVLVNENYLHEVAGEGFKTRDPYKHAQCAGEVSIRPIDQFKFGGGWMTVISTPLLKYVGVPDGFGHYGLEDTFIMTCSQIMRQKGMSVRQFILENEIIVEDQLFRFNPYKQHLETINKQEEFKRNAHANFEAEVIKFVNTK